MQVPNPGCPKPHSLSLKHSGFRLEFAETGPPLLRKVVLDNYWGLTLDDCWRFLHRCPNLEIFAAHCESGKQLTPTSTTTRIKFLEVGRLKKLHLKMEALNSGQLLDQLRAPALETIELIDYDTSGGPRASNGFPQLVPFLSRSGAHLKSMNIELDMTVDEFLTSVYHTPSLTSLEIRDRWSFVPSRVLDTLIMQPMKSHPRVLPLLECVTFTGFDESKSDLVAKIVLSRWGGNNGTELSTATGNEISKSWERRLRYVSLYGCNLRLPSSIVGMPMIMACIEDGLVVIEEESEFSASLFDARF